MRGLTFRNKLQAYSNTKRRPEFHDQFMLIPQTRTFNWPFLQVGPSVGPWPLCRAHPNRCVPYAPQQHRTTPHAFQAFYEDLASRSYVEDINLLSRGPTPAGATINHCISWEGGIRRFYFMFITDYTHMTK